MFSLFKNDYKIFMCTRHAESNLQNAIKLHEMLILFHYSLSALIMFSFVKNEYNIFMCTRRAESNLQNAHKLHKNIMFYYKFAIH